MATNGGSTKKHFVLVHGACQGAWCWYKLTPLLKSPGHRVTVLDLVASGINPKQVNALHSFSDYVQPLMEFKEYSVPNSISIKQEEKVILVGHSLGGLVISKAMETFPDKIFVAVFLTTFMPKAVPEVTAYILTAKGTSTNFTFGPRYISSNLYDLSSPEVIKLMLARPIRIFSADDMSKQMTMSKHNYGSVKRVYIIAELDKGIPKDVQRWIIEKDSVDDVKEIVGSDHMVMMSKPQELFACLQEIAGEA
ncbi:hypothetical protein MKX03_033468 [Papaver bracteatum]|nr:hypothetical protein MKX03_033468 [Papaver bracteatum]